jgi:hypothetical protein
LSRNDPLGDVTFRVKQLTKDESSQKTFQLLHAKHGQVTLELTAINFGKDKSLSKTLKIDNEGGDTTDVDVEAVLSEEESVKLLIAKIREEVKTAEDLKRFNEETAKKLEQELNEANNVDSESTEAEPTSDALEKLHQQKIILDYIQGQLDQMPPQEVTQGHTASDFIGVALHHLEDQVTDFKNHLLGKKPEWENWAQTISCNPTEIINLDQKNYMKQIEDTILKAVAHKKNVRCAAFGHSWAPFSVTDGYLLVVKNLKETKVHKDEQKNRWLVDLQPGVDIAQLDKVLKENPDASLALPANAILTTAQYGGVLSMGCHGSGQKHQTLSDYIVAMKVVTYNATTKKVETVVFDENNMEELLNAKVNLGCFGVITEFTLEVVPFFNFEVFDSQPYMDFVVDEARPNNLRSVLEDNNAVELFWFPFNGTNPIFPEADYNGNREQMAIKTWNYPKDPQTRPSMANWQRKGQWRNTYISTYLGGFAFRSLYLLPKLAPLFTWGLHQFFLKSMYASTRGVLPVDWALHYRNGIDGMPCRDMEFAIPIKKDFSDVNKIIEAWRHVVDTVFEYRKKNLYPCNLLLEMRMNRNSDCPLSNMYSAEECYFCTIEVLSVVEVKQDLWYEFCNKIAEKWIALGGRPHWAKEWDFLDNIADKLPVMYGDRLVKYNEFRKKYDGAGVFLNDVLRTKVFKGMV